MPIYRTISNWLFFCCFMVFVMAVIGAVTRLTESGLSITEWKPITGTLPPLNDAAWQHQFELYKQTPEFSAKHFWMDLSDFKKIFFWEWVHRLWGRKIGIVYALPLLWFLARRQIPKGTGWKFAGLLVLGGAQGFMGWFMVQSGLVDQPSVSHFRLAAHLALALSVFALMFWMALDFRNNLRRHSPHRPAIAAGWACLGLVAATIIWGAFVAGLDAGMIYNSFPNMGAGLIPPDFGNIHSSPAGVQFTHRWLAITTFCAVMGYVALNRQDRIAWLPGIMVMAQVGLGIATLLTQVDITLAAFHQAGAITLLGLMLLSQHHLVHRNDQA